MSDLGSAIERPEIVLFHRGISFTVGHERDGLREWTVFPSEGPIGALRGKVSRRSSLGSYRVAVLTAQAEIDRLLEESTDQH